MKRLLALLAILAPLTVSLVPSAASALSCARFDPSLYDHVFVATAGAHTDGMTEFTISEIWKGDPLPPDVLVPMTQPPTADLPAVGKDYLVGTDETLASGWCSHVPADDPDIAALRPAEVQQPLDARIVQDVAPVAAATTDPEPRWIVAGSVALVLAGLAAAGLMIRRSRGRA